MPRASAGSVLAMSWMALWPCSGMALWAATPWVRTRQRTAPFWAVMICNSVGSPTTAASTGDAARP